MDYSTILHYTTPPPYSNSMQIRVNKLYYMKSISGPYPVILSTWQKSQVWMYELMAKYCRRGNIHIFTLQITSCAFNFVEETMYNLIV